MLASMLGSQLINLDYTTPNERVINYSTNSPKSRWSDKRTLRSTIINSRIKL